METQLFERSNMPVDPKVRILLDRMQQMRMRPLSGMIPEEGRRMILNTMRRYDGMIHAFIGFLGVIGQAQEAMDYACSWLKDLFSVKISEKV
jgi:hypothetical protein